MVDFNNEWYRETCIENGLDPDNVLSQSAIEVARARAMEMKKYMDTKGKYKDKKLHEKIDFEINRLNNERIEFMLYALTYAEIIKEMGYGANEFIKSVIKRQEFARR